MKRLLFLVVLIAGCSEDFEAQEARAKHDQNIKIAADVAKDIIYLQDERTGLCFAYYWGGAGNGGPALATVPFDKVEKYLLNAKPNQQPSK